MVAGYYTIDVVVDTKATYALTKSDLSLLTSDAVVGEKRLVAIN